MLDDECAAAASVLFSHALVSHIAAFQSGYPQVAMMLVEAKRKWLLFVQEESHHNPRLGALPRLAVPAGELQTLEYLFELQSLPHTSTICRHFQRDEAAGVAQA